MRAVPCQPLRRRRRQHRVQAVRGDAIHQRTDGADSVPRYTCTHAGAHSQPDASAHAEPHARADSVADTGAHPGANAIADARADAAPVHDLAAAVPERRALPDP
jgi:hypothetical protein